MLVTGDFAREKSELETVLASGIFDRAPGLAQLLNYVCGKYFQGKGKLVKEYDIAVEALGRPPDFDQKKDSGVRVQFHRLRERLAEYYQNDGADHAVHIVIPQGQYIPRFEIHAAGQVVAPRTHAPGTAAPTEEDLPSPTAIPNRRPVWLIGAATLVVLAGGVVWLVDRPQSRIPEPPASHPVAAPSGDTVRILVGLTEGSFVDGFGRTWESDRFFEGGTVVKVPNHAIAATRDPRLYQSRRQGNFRYDIPLQPGVYELRLHFAETNFGENNSAGFGGEGSRAFGVLINGNSVLQRLDVVGETGASTADIKVFRDVSPAPDGKLHLSFEPLVGIPFLNAIEITPGIPGRLRPIRILAQTQPYTDAAGSTWEPDRYANGGRTVKRSNEVAGTTAPQLFAGERFGNLTYTIPVPPGRYGIRLYMAEQWVGPDMPGGGGVGSRIFDILCNGVVLARDFDIFKRAGGSNRALVETFHNIEPNHQGKLVLSLVPNKNFPLVNALEVFDETK
jgi:malectin (di-glucose binding ER protein)